MNIPAEIMQHVESNHPSLSFEATGGGCDYVVRRMGERAAVLTCPEMGSSPDGLEAMASVVIYDDADWIDGEERRFTTARAAMAFMASLPNGPDEGGELPEDPTGGSPIDYTHRFKFDKLTGELYTTFHERPETSVANVDDEAKRIFAQLSPELISYAAEPDRGIYRGFAALHDTMDANCLLMDEPEGCTTVEAREAYYTFLNAVMAEVSRMIIATSSELSPLVRKLERESFAAETAGEGKGTYRYNLPSELMEYAATLGTLRFEGTGGGCDHIVRRFSPELCAVILDKDGECPETLATPCEVSVMNGEAWDSGVSLDMPDAKTALQFMAAMKSARFFLL